MNFKIIAKQIYRGFLVNWKLFAMLIFFCISTLAMVLGSLFFVVQFNQEVYQPAVNQNSFSVGYLKNGFTNFSDPEPKFDFRTNQEFETYFLEQMNQIGETEFNENDLKEIYENDGYVNWVKTDNSKKAGWEKLINYSADFLGNFRFKILTQYLETNSGWTFNLWNLQDNFVKVSGATDYLHFYHVNVKKNSTGLIKFDQMLSNDSKIVSAYINENQFQQAYQLGDVVSLKFLDPYHSQNLWVKIVGTFVDYVNFASREAQDLSLMVDSTDYFNFVQNQENDDVQKMIDYREQANNSAPVLTLLTKESFSKSNFAQQFNDANQMINDLFFADFEGHSLSNQLSQGMYFTLDQKIQLTNLMMISASFLFLILFFAVLYFLMMQIIKTDWQTSQFLNYQGMSYAEISFIQISRLTIPLIFAFGCGFLASFGVKYLFWTAYVRAFDVRLSFFYFHWLVFLILFLTLVAVFGILFLINFLINQKLGKEKNLFQRLSFPNWLSLKFKRTLKIKNPRLVIVLAYGSKNVYQLCFFFLITFIIFVIMSFSFNFLLNVNWISRFSEDNYSFVFSISASQGSIIDEIETSKKPVTSFSANWQKKFIPIGNNINLETNSWFEIFDQLQNLFSDDLSSFYLSHLFTQQINQDFADEIKVVEWSELDDQIKAIITSSDFDQLKIIINQAALLNEQLKKQYDWEDGFNVNFGAWGGNLFSDSWSRGRNSFLSLQGDVLDAWTNQYLTPVVQAFAVDAAEENYQLDFEHLLDQRKPETFIKTAEQIAQSKLDQALVQKHDGQVVVDEIVNAYFPYKLREFPFLKLKINLNNQISTEVYLKNVGINYRDNWISTFILNQEQLYRFLDCNLKTYQSSENVQIPFAEIINSDLNRLDNGVYSIRPVPYFYNNILLRTDGQGTKINNYLPSLESLNIFGVNMYQLTSLVSENLAQYVQLITSVLIFSSFLMFSIYLIIIYLIIKENEGYFQNFKALGYQTKEIVGFLLPWYLIVIALAAVSCFLIIYFLNDSVEQVLAEMLMMPLKYQVLSYTEFALIVVPILFMLAIWWIVHAFIKRIKVTNIV